MRFKKVSKLIEKINVLHDSLLSIDEEISPIEKDLLLNYIRQLYEEVLAVDSDEPTYSNLQVNKSVVDLPNEKEEVKTVSKPIVTKVSANGKLDESEIATIVEEPIAEQKPVELPSEVEISQKGQVEDVEAEELNNELSALFEFKEAKELSEKLSSMPISDLNRAMGINDKFLIVNELFSGDSNAFKACVENINQMSDYNEAKSYLLSKVAGKYNWSDAEKLKKAAGFISLIQRRFR